MRPFSSYGVPSEVERELRSLAVRYAGAVDQRDVAALADLFTADAELHVHRAPPAAPGVFVGAAEISGVARRLARFPRTFHFLGQSAYADGEEEGTATGEVYCIAHHISDHATPNDLVMYIRYHDDYRLDDGLWRIARRNVYVDFESTDARIGSASPFVAPSQANR